MKNHKKLIIFGSVAVLLVIIIGFSLYFSGGVDNFRDGCSQKDRQNNNCVLAGHCGPEGSIIDQTADCDTKNYDSQFCHTGNPKDCLPDNQ